MISQAGINNQNVGEGLALPANVFLLYNTVEANLDRTF